MNHLRSNFLPVLENWPIKSAAARTNGLSMLRQSARTSSMLWLGGVPVLSKEDPEVKVSDLKTDLMN